MKHPSLLILPLLLLAGAAAAEQTVVYKVKNADGTTTYSQDPVPGAEVRVIGSGGGPSRAVGQPEPPPTPIPDELQAGGEEYAAARSEACATATANLAVFDSGQPVTLARGDGTPETLTGEQLDAARARARGEVAAYCTDDTDAAGD